uniref:Uncharacterized protein n=1 Tax=Brassica campestris TaxID=3711 RepID=A0A3P6CVB1_BRACM|nr:unnamed protein product [Brassica rapa]
MAGGDKRRGLSKSCALLIVIAGIERYAFKGVASNLVTYLTDVVKMSNSRAATTVNTWSGFTFMLPLFSAPFADSYGDRFFNLHHPRFFFSILCWTSGIDIDGICWVTFHY